jgi:hypothetical protein
MAEEVVGIIPHVLQSTGRIQSKLNTIIISNQRLIIAQFTAAMMQEALAQSKAKGGKGLSGRLLAGRVLTPSDIVDYTDKYWSMKPDTIVSENPANFTLEIAGISAAEVEHQVQGPDEDSHIGFDRYILTINSIQGQYSFIFDADPQDLDALRRILGDKFVGSARPCPVKPVSSHAPASSRRETETTQVKGGTTFCANCGQRVPYLANFCPECGKVIKE